MEGIVIKDLCKSYWGEKGHSHSAVQDVNMIWKPGEFISLMGESGSGKSTLAKMILGLETPDSGSIQMDGIELTTLRFSEWKPQRRFLQGVFQDASGTMNPRRSTYSNIEEAMVHLTTLTSSQRKERILHLMEQTQLSPKLLEVPVKQLSGGEQRRFALVRAMSVHPKYLVLDEATSGLDLLSAASVIQTIHQFKKEMRCAFLFITHDLQSANQLSDRILKMQQGRLVLEGIK